MPPRPHHWSVQPVKVVGVGPDAPGSNANSGLTGTKTGVALADAVQLVGASTPIPDGFALVLKSKKGNTDGIRVAFSKADAENIAVAYPLAAQETVGYFITDVNLIWAFIPEDDVLVWTVEQKV
jgi:hypothetical protein